VRTNIWKLNLQGNAILKKKRHANLFDLEQTCAHISLKKNIYERAYAQNVLPFISIYKDIQNIPATTHILLKRNHICMLKVLCQNVHIQSILLPKITYAHLKYFINIKFFVASSTFIYTYMHIGESISCHAHTCIYLKRNFHAIYLHLKCNSTSYIHFGKHSRATFKHVYIHKALDHLFNIYMFYLKGICP